MCDQEIHSYNIVCDRGACTASQNAPFEWCKTPPAAIWLVDICASQNDIFFSTERREMWMLVVKESQLKGPNGLNWWWKQQGNIGQAAGAEKKLLLTTMAYTQQNLKSNVMASLHSDCVKERIWISVAGLDLNWLQAGCELVGFPRWSRLGGRRLSIEQNNIHRTAKPFFSLGFF